MIAVFISGQGRSLQNLIDKKFDIDLVGTQNINCPGFKKAQEIGLPTFCVKDIDPFSEAERLGIELIILAGYTDKLQIPDKWLQRVINIHPSLLPSFGGKGMYGYRVHAAAIKSGVKFSGCTVHYATNEYDTGPIILQRIVKVEDDDNPESLASKVFEEEKIALPQAIEMHLNQKLKITGNRVYCSN